ncbi:hypothetical protein HZF06_07705 [Clostridium intestinale]|uniref:YitT family protein n=2 Tax=Clostridium intestinale TaxID=36845 RepID=A0A7D6ZJ86_9CLOT|nr:hypothetical protein HZF06_07705 [Clostridium intestinale]
MTLKEILTNYTKLYWKRSIMLLVGVLISAFGMTLLIKSGLGQSTVSGISYNIGYVTNIKTGTILALINYLCFIGQVILLKRSFKVIQVFQLLITTIFSSTVNLFMYDFKLISELQVDNYIINLIILIIGIVFMSYGVSLMMVADLIFLPFEGFCNVLSVKLKMQFGTLRRYVDILLVVISVVLIYVFNIPNTSVREGTIIYTFLFGTLLNIFMKAIKNYNEDKETE